MDLLARGAAPAGAPGRADVRLDLDRFANFQLSGFVITRIGYRLETLHAQFLFGRSGHRT
jgi:hypothetical protein